jgi:hypothetical protein
MGFHIQHRYGGDDANPPLEALCVLLDEVDEDRRTRSTSGLVWSTSPAGIGVYPGWLVTYEDVEELEVEPRHLEVGADRPRVLRLMRAATEGDLPTLEAEPWSRGYGPSQ